MGHRLRLVARLLVFAFCWLTAVYALMASSAFAYQQFLRPRVFSWVGVFSDWHARAAWIWLAVLVAVLWPCLRGRQREPAAALLIVSTGVIVANTWRPVLPELSDGTASLAVSLTALVPILWVAIVDHLGASWREAAAGDRNVHEARLFVAAVATAAFMVVFYASMASIELASAFEPDLMTGGLIVTLIASAAANLVVAMAGFVAAALIGRLAGRRLAVEYVMLAAALVALIGLLFDRFVADTLALHGSSAVVAATCFAVSIVAAWSGTRLHTRRPLSRSAVDLLFGAAADTPASPVAAIRALAGVAVLAVAIRLAARQYDWDDLILRSGVVIVWLVAFGAMHRILCWRRLPGAVAMASVCVAALAAQPAVVAAAPTRVLDRYAVHNASFRVADGLLRAAPVTPRFDVYLRANSGFTSEQVAPVDIGPVHASAAARRPPHIFLFVIDSLRQDYLSPYNPKVSFTPRLAEFARDNLMFRNAFTRYGGTGLSMPSIWAGSAILHKQYVKPFAPMNALDKLLNANGYEKWMSRDHITDELLGPGAQFVELDRGVQEMDFDFCRTLEEITARLGTAAASERPVFAHSRSLNLHLARVRHGSVPPGESYPGLLAPYASRVFHMDACFGRFVDFLKSRRLYDQSLIVVTSDHGERMGEDGQWGHSYHMTPEVIQIPLLLHLPADVRWEHVDRDAVALSTDIVPTIYAALGVAMPGIEGLRGRSLVGPAYLGEHARRDDLVLAASYGAVYATLRHNGRSLYIRDAINSREQAYERSGGTWSEVPITRDMRAINDLRIRQHVDRLARAYHVEPRF